MVPHLTRALAVLDLIEVPKDKLAFIVMEEWSAQLAADTPCSLVCFLDALRQCIEVHLLYCIRTEHILTSVSSTLRSCMPTTSPTWTFQYATSSRTMSDTTPSLTMNSACATIIYQTLVYAVLDGQKFHQS